MYAYINKLAIATALKNSKYSNYFLKQCVIPKVKKLDKRWHGIYTMQDVRRLRTAGIS